MIQQIQLITNLRDPDPYFTTLLLLSRSLNFVNLNVLNHFIFNNFFRLLRSLNFQPVKIKNGTKSKTISQIICRNEIFEPRNMRILVNFMDSDPDPHKMNATTDALGVFFCLTTTRACCVHQPTFYILMCRREPERRQFSLQFIPHLAHLLLINFGTHSRCDLIVLLQVRAVNFVPMCS